MNPDLPPPGGRPKRKAAEGVGTLVNAEKEMKAQIRRIVKSGYSLPSSSDSLPTAVTHTTVIDPNSPNVCL